jgi:hypothetical protein
MTATHNFCQFCIGTHSKRALCGSAYTVSEGDVCEITHRAIRNNEIQSGCENYYDQAGTAYFIDVYSDIEYIDKQGNVAEGGWSLTRIIRPREMPDSCEAWRAVYSEALNILAKRFTLSINNEGKWLSSNIFRFRTISNSEDHKRGIKTIKIVFTSSVFPHGVTA